MQNKHSEKLEEGLKLLDMPLEGGALHFVSDIKLSDFLQQHPAEYFALEQAQKLKATAVYFKKFANRPSLPQIYIYDYTNENYQESEFGEIHKHIWNSGIVPLIYVFTKTAIRIIDCSKQPTQKGENLETNYLVDILFSASEIQEKLKHYSAKLFDNGSFWDKPENKDKFNFQQFAYTKLKIALVNLKNNFIKDAVKIGLTKEIAQRLFLQGILIKYLEEKGDSGIKVFPKNYFKKYDDANDFCEVLEKRGKILELFKDLHNHKFNGEIFHWEDESEINKIKNTDLSELAKFFRADETDKQYEIWRLYSFEYIPIEFISSIYDEFIGDNKKGVVYTPLHLAKFLVDEAMPINEPKENFRVIDPACGSGIFLVLAYKRLVEWWRIRHPQQKTDVQTLKRILVENIEGLDISEEATQLSIFSLSLALCDLLSPTEIWFELKFDNLKQKNIQCADFFDWLKQNSENKFDLVIGNPPFTEKLETKAAQKTEAEYIKKRSENKLIPTPQKQIALLFAEQSISLLTENGLLCLLLPASSLLYNKTSLTYREYFFSSHNIFQIIDFTALSSVLWDGKRKSKEPNKNNKPNVAVVALFLENRKPDDEDILHLTIKRTKAAKEKIYFEIDEYDFHWISKDLAINEPLIWKINLFGGGQLYHLISRLKALRTLEKFLEQKRKDGWFFGEGYIKGNGDKKAEHITNKLTLPTDAFDGNGIDTKQLYIESENIFYRTAEKNKNIFLSPHILIKESVYQNKIPVAFLDYDLTFKNEIVGINSPEKYKHELMKVEKSFLNNNDTYVFYIMCLSSRTGISRSHSTILKNDIMNLPYPEDEKELEFCASEKIIRDDVLNYLIEYSSSGENSKVINPVTDEQLKNFASVFCDVLNSIYEENNYSFQLCRLIKTNSFMCCEFSHQENKDTDIFVEQSSDLEKYIEDLIHNEVGETLIYNRIIKIYKTDKIYLIKPNILRYWLGSIALWDADKVLADLIAGGY